uniref:Chromo domain-containing protein n=1 Tax=Steinernema glaseri TaxID=37863 RepID=A0A1I8A3W2_9BILA
MVDRVGPDGQHPRAWVRPRCSCVLEHTKRRDRKLEKERFGGLQWGPFEQNGELFTVNVDDKAKEARLVNAEGIEEGHGEKRAKDQRVAQRRLARTVNRHKRPVNRYNPRKGQTVDLSLVVGRTASSGAIGCATKGQSDAVLSTFLSYKSSTHPSVLPIVSLLQNATSSASQASPLGVRIGTQPLGSDLSTCDVTAAAFASPRAVQRASPLFARRCCGLVHRTVARERDAPRWGANGERGEVLTSAGRARHRRLLHLHMTGADRRLVYRVLWDGSKGDQMRDDQVTLTSRGLIWPGKALG